MALFEGLACFSPEVSRTVRDTWVTHGGMITQLLKQRMTIKYIFCNGRSDPWVLNLVRKATPVFDARWVTDAAVANFCIPISPYLLNDPECPSTNTSSRTLVASPKTPANQVSRRPAVPPALLPSKRPFQPQDEPESAERPRKKLRVLDPEATLNELSMSTTSRVKVVEEALVVPVVQKKAIPLIDLSQMQCKSRGSSKLNITLVKNSVVAPELRKRRVPKLVFERTGNGTPRLSLSAALQALQPIPTDSCALITSGAYHEGKRFQYDEVSSVA